MQNSFEILLWAIFPQIYRCIHHKYSSTRFKHLEWWMTEKNTSTLLILQFYWCSGGMAQCSEAALFSGGGSWDAGSNPFQFLSFFLSSYFYPSAFYCLFSLLTLLASRDFCENVFLVMLKRNSINLHFKFGAGQKWEPASRRVILEIFWTVSLKAHDWSSWILTECNLSWKIVKYRILSEVCMINSTVSPQMWCIKSIKGWFTRPQTCWQDFVK